MFCAHKMYQIKAIERDFFAEIYFWNRRWSCTKFSQLFGFFYFGFSFVKFHLGEGREKHDFVKF